MRPCSRRTFDGEDRRGRLVARRLAGRVQRGAEGRTRLVAAVRRPCGRHGNSAARHRTRHRVRLDPEWSPDGRQIAFTRYEQSDWTVRDVRPIGIYSMADGTVRAVGPLTTRRPRPVPGRQTTDRPARGEGFFFDWSPDGRSLLTYPSEATVTPSSSTRSTGRGGHSIPSSMRSAPLPVRAGSVSRPDRRSGLRRSRTARTKEEPRVVGPGVQGVGGLVAGRGFEPLTFGL